MFGAGAMIGQLASVTRRGWLKGAVASAAAIGLSKFACADAASSSITNSLAGYMGGAAKRPLPAEVVEKTKHHILDTVAAIISGNQLPPGIIALRFAKAHQGESVATIVGTKLLSGAIDAALVNGMLAHSDETDDSHAPSHSHPGCAVVPAALATGEQFGISGSHFIRAVCLGYDIGPRVTATLGGLPYQMKSHHSAHSIAGTFGASAAAGSIAGLDENQMRWILDYASQEASGIAAWERDTEHIEKSLVFAGFPARNGVTAALLIQLGGTGVEDIFSGADNFFLTFAPGTDPIKMVDGLGTRFEVTNTNIKKWTVGSPIQAPLDAFINLRKKHPFVAKDVAAVTVRVATSEANTVNNRAMPDICLQHMVAVMLVDQGVSFSSAHDKKRMTDPAILDMRSKVKLVPDEGLERLYPKRETIVEVELLNGMKLIERVEAVRGTSDNPMTAEEVVGKAQDLIGPSLGVAKAQKLIATLMSLEKLTNIRELRPLLQPS